MPEILFEELEAERKRLVDARERYGDYIKPDALLN